MKIGLEVHCQLTALRTKLFCSCSSDYRVSQPNSRVCPVCFGLPGSLPVLNRKAVEYAATIAITLHCNLPKETTFYRKNYYYPDLSKNFQISQYDRAGGIPMASDGYLSVEGKRIGIRRIQLEEDPGKLTYEGTIEKSVYSLVDYNRAGVALVEIVTEPELHGPKEAKLFLEILRETIESLGVSNGELEGAMRCDANISLTGGVRVEIKNISSFKEVAKALSYEILRQKTFKESARSRAETRHWDERRSVTIAMRTKEEQRDYRYFPEPDLPPIKLGEEEIQRVKSQMPELPEARASRLVSLYRIPTQTATEIAKNKQLSEFFETCARSYNRRRDLANWILAELKDYFEREGGGERLSPENFVGFLRLLETGTIARAQGRSVLRQLIKTGARPESLIGARGVAAVRDERSLEKTVNEFVSVKPELLEQARSEKKAFNFIVGQVLRKEPNAEPSLIAKILLKKLKRKAR